MVTFALCVLFFALGLIAQWWAMHAPEQDYPKLRGVISVLPPLILLCLISVPILLGGLSGRIAAICYERVSQVAVKDDDEDVGRIETEDGGS